VEQAASAIVKIKTLTSSKYFLFIFHLLLLVGISQR